MNFVVFLSACLAVVYGMGTSVEIGDWGVPLEELLSFETEESLSNDLELSAAQDLIKELQDQLRAVQEREAPHIPQMEDSPSAWTWDSVYLVINYFLFCAFIACCLLRIILERTHLVLNWISYAGIFYACYLGIENSLRHGRVFIALPDNYVHRYLMVILFTCAGALIATDGVQVLRKTFQIVQRWKMGRKDVPEPPTSASVDKCASGPSKITGTFRSSV
jgi:hypothetical protein